MQRFSSTFLFLILFPVSIANSSCNDCGLALADLITQVALSGFLTITVGVPFNIPNLIENIPNVLLECGNEVLQTHRANKSQSRLKVDYDKSNDSTFSQNVLDNNFEVPEIPPGMAAEEAYSLAFDEPGEYRIITFADDKDDVTERNEDNNTSDAANLSIKSVDQPFSKPSLIIRVLPNPNFKRAKHAPFVRLLDRNVTIK